MLFWGILGCCFSFFFPAEVGGEHWVLAPVPCTRALQVISFIFPILVAPNTSLNSCWSLNPYTQTYLGEYLGLHHLQLCSRDCLQTTRACPKQLNDTKKENFIPEKKKKNLDMQQTSNMPHITTGPTKTLPSWKPSAGSSFWRAEKLQALIHTTRSCHQLRL